MIAFNFELVIEKTGIVNWLLLSPIPLVFGVGIIVGLVLNRKRPQRNARLTEVDVEDLSTTT